MAEFAAAVVEPLDEAECLQLISAGGIGRIGYTGRYGPTVLPVNFVLYEQAVVFRTGQDSPMGEDLRTGIADADYVVAFEVDEISQATREGWSILIRIPPTRITGRRIRRPVHRLPSLQVPQHPGRHGRDRRPWSRRPARGHALVIKNLFDTKSRGLPPPPGCEP